MIEINDKSHEQLNRKIRDNKIKEICNSANRNLITFYTKYKNEENYVLNRINQEINKYYELNKEKEDF